MRKITLTALVALCAVLPGRLNATSISNVSPQIISSGPEQVNAGLDLTLFNPKQGELYSLNVEFDAEQGEIDPKLVEIILKEAALKYDLDLTKLVDQFQKGDLIIEKQVIGYALVETKSGGITIAIIDEF